MGTDTKTDTADTHTRHNCTKKMETQMRTRQETAVTNMSHVFAYVFSCS